MDNMPLNPKNYNYHDNYVDNIKWKRRKLWIKIFYILAGFFGLIYILGLFILEDSDFERAYKLVKFPSFIFWGLAYWLGKKQEKEEIDKTAEDLQ